MVTKRSEAKETVEQTVARLSREMADPVLMAARFEQLRNRVAAYEREFGLPSADIHGAIDRGDLVETWEVCKWIMDYESLLRAETRRAAPSPGPEPRELSRRP